MSVLGDDNPDSANDAPSDGTGDPADGEGVRLERLSVRNNHGEGHTVQLAVESGEGLLHLDTYQLEAGGGTVVEGDWTGATGAYLVHARLDDGEIQSTDVAGSVGEDAECVRMVLRIDAEGELGILYGTDCER
jgi:hypothetical protein